MPIRSTAVDRTHGPPGRLRRGNGTGVVRIIEFDTQIYGPQSVSLSRRIAVPGATGNAALRTDVPDYALSEVEMWISECSVRCTGHLSAISSNLARCVSSSAPESSI